MRTPKEIDEILKNIPYESWKERWCKADICACMGCVNGSGFRYIKEYAVTHKEFIAWKDVYSIHESLRHTT
jgi:hypothetical protein